RLYAMQARHATHWRQRPDRVERAVPGQCPRQPRQRRRRELQPLLQAARQAVARRRFGVAPELGLVGLRQPMSVSLFPAEATPNEQAVLAHWHVAARHDVAWQATDLAG